MISNSSSPHRKPGLSGLFRLRFFLVFFHNSFGFPMASSPFQSLSPNSKKAKRILCGRFSRISTKLPRIPLRRQKLPKVVGKFPDLHRAARAARADLTQSVTWSTSQVSPWSSRRSLLSCRRFGWAATEVPAPSIAVHFVSSHCSGGDSVSPHVSQYAATFTSLWDDEQGWKVYSGCQATVGFHLKGMHCF